MDLVKIGKYIAGKRKALGMTQKQLAEKFKEHFSSGNNICSDHGSGFRNGFRS